MVQVRQIETTIQCPMGSCFSIPSMFKSTPHFTHLRTPWVQFHPPALRRFLSAPWSMLLGPAGPFGSRKIACLPREPRKIAARILIPALPHRARGYALLTGRHDLCLPTVLPSLLAKRHLFV